MTPLRLALDRPLDIGMVKIVVLPVPVSRCNIMYCRTQVAGPETGEIRELNQDNRRTRSCGGKRFGGS
jgi:hypothetical protein